MWTTLGIVLSLLKCHLPHLELPDVSVLHHDGEEPDDHLGARPQHHLPLASLLGIAHALERVSETVHTNHGFLNN